MIFPGLSSEILRRSPSFTASPFPFLVLTAWAVTAAGLLGCGKRGDPLPPLRLVPAPVEEIGLRQTGPFIHLEWVAPSHNTDGSTEVDLETAEVLRRVVDVIGEGDEGGEDTPETEEAPAPELEGEVQAEAPPPLAFESEATVVARVESRQGGEQVSYREPWDPSWEGKRVEYAIRYVNRKGRQSGPSALAQIEPLPPLSPPKDLAAEEGAGFVRLRWSVELEESKGETPYQYVFRVFRRSGEGEYPDRPLDSSPVGEMVFEDTTVVFGKTWCYAVRKVALRRPEDPASGAGGQEAPSGEKQAVLIESLDSEEICLTAVDTFAPAIPGELVAVASGDAILLSWREIEAEDLGGYRVYRSVKEQGPFELLTPESLKVASYTDRGAQPGILYYYAVSAEDQADPPNESPRSPPVAARLP